MPIYSYKDKNSGDKFTIMMSIKEMEEFEQTNIHLQRILVPIPVGDPVRLGVTGNPSSFNDLVKEVKKNNYGSNINNKNGEF